MNSRWRRSQGFTLIELVSVIIIVGVLAAIAVPRYLAIGQDARLAALKSLTGTLLTTTINAHSECALEPQCDYTNGYQFFVMRGQQNANMGWGWVRAGDNLNNNQIDAWINYSGFTASLLPPSTKFSLIGSPDPTNCAVIYTTSTGPSQVPAVTSLTSGC